MTSRIDPEELAAWCRVPAAELENHPEAKIGLRILSTPDEVHHWVARRMVDEVLANNDSSRPTRWILPCGPTGQYTHFTRMVNQEKVSLRNVQVFHMDEFLDWQGRPLALDNRFSLEGTMRRVFYDPIHSELAVPEENRHFPSIYSIDALTQAIEAAGGVDTAYGGVGFRGHIAFNEPPHSPWYTVSEEAFRSSRTRILHLNDDTLIAQAQRVTGGNTHEVPPMCITMGMLDILSAGRIRLISETGAWKQTVVRVLLFGPTTVEYPVTFAQGHKDVSLIVDQATAAAPLGG